MSSLSRILVFLFALLWAVPVSAQGEQLWLARYCVNEAGFQIEKPFEETTIPNDCSAMHQSLVNNFESDRLRTWMMRRYGDNVFNRERTERRYIPFLRPFSRRAPRGWRHADWDLHGPRFDEIYEYAGQILRGEVEPVCQPHHWGAPWRSMRRRSRRRGWVRLDCGETVNDYWRVPARSVQGD